MHDENVSGVPTNRQIESSDTQAPTEEQTRKRRPRHRRTEDLIRQHTKNYQGDVTDDV